ncbi:hypothetical protein [Streptomyces sp. NBC_00827]|uniref:hypothetical protein n=1 Tax=Streptomyces sp. NBC_00827 TaxID=2903677 RepID=UPI003866670E|nr:hypothetical protein OG569_02245 [Streptomyces sp. NBC_00827]
MNAARVTGALCPLVALLALAVPALMTLRDRREVPMTFHYTDPDGDHLTISPGLTDAATGQSILDAAAITITAQRHRDGQTATVYVPVDQVEELVAGLRDVRRQAATQEPR